MPNPISGNRGVILLGLARLFVSSHFLYELQDKIRNFQHWRSVIYEQAGLGMWSLILVIVLLVVGNTSLLSGRLLWVGFLALAIFQIPTSILFEDSLYESFDSISALGGVFAVAGWTWEREQLRRQSGESSSHSFPQEEGGDRDANRQSVRAGDTGLQQSVHTRLLADES